MLDPPQVVLSVCHAFFLRRPRWLEIGQQIDGVQIWTERGAVQRYLEPEMLAEARVSMPGQATRMDSRRCAAN
eukprot:2132484-Lingulodinium_polyedra.AAC.1